MSHEHQRIEPVSSLHFCTRLPLPRALSAALFYASTFSLNVHSSRGRSQESECNLYLRMSPQAEKGPGEAAGRPASAERRDFLLFFSGPCCLRGQTHARAHTHCSHAGTTPLVWQVQSGFLHEDLPPPASDSLPLHPIPCFLCHQQEEARESVSLSSIPSAPHTWGQ